jgi:hypothetical protein
MNPSLQLHFQQIAAEGAKAMQEIESGICAI